jgi:hypothetical protein
VLQSDAERRQLQDSLPPSWRDRVTKAIGQARRAHPLEVGVLDALEAFLSSIV